jgi:hypothetical protein
MDELERLGKLFAGRHFHREVILLCDLVDMMAERGLSWLVTPSCDGCSTKFATH